MSGGPVLGWMEVTACLCYSIDMAVSLLQALYFLPNSPYGKKYVLRGDRGHKKHEITVVELFQHLWPVSGCASSVKYPIFFLFFLTLQ